MKNDLDIKLYNEYLNGEKEAFELLYNKYKDKITYLNGEPEPLPLSFRGHDAGILPISSQSRIPSP